MKNDSAYALIMLIILLLGSIIGVSSAGGCTSKTGNQIIEVHVDRIERDNVLSINRDTLKGVVTITTYVTKLDHILEYDAILHTAKIRRRYLDRISITKQLIQ